MWATIPMLRTFDSSELIDLLLYHIAAQQAGVIPHPCGDEFWLVCAGLPSSVRLCFGQPCSPCESGRFRRPSPRSPYTYTASGASPAVIVSLSKVPLGKAPTVTARGTLGNWVKTTHTRRSLRGKARLLPRAASTIRVTMLRRRDTASLPRSRLVSHHANRRLAVPLRSLLARAALTRPSAVARLFS